MPWQCLKEGFQVWVGLQGTSPFPMPSDAGHPTGSTRLRCPAVLRSPCFGNSIHPSAFLRPSREGSPKLAFTQGGWEGAKAGCRASRRER